MAAETELDLREAGAGQSGQSGTQLSWPRAGSATVKLLRKSKQKLKERRTRNSKKRVKHFDLKVKTQWFFTRKLGKYLMKHTIEF